MKYINPIIPGFNPDPSICRVGGEFYLVTSTFEFFPGIPVYHSRDLVNWTQIGNCIERPGQLPLGEVEASGGIWAPTIRFYRGRFYVTAFFEGYGNFIICSENPATGWSDPVKADMGGIDPSLFFEEDRAYYCTNQRGADGREAISLAEIEVETGHLLGDIKQIWNGTGGGFLEAPHIYHIGGWYYLLAAEGGTGLNHMVTVARSRDMWGEYESFDGNPILSNRNDTTKTVACTGHGDLVDDEEGNWWMVHLATRTANIWCSHIGRETFLMPVTWRDGWPVVGSDGKSHIECEAPLLGAQKPLSGWKADFSQSKPRWLFLREPKAENYEFREGHLFLKPTQVKLSDAAGSPTLAMVRPLDMECRAVARLVFVPCQDGDEAGLVVYLSNLFHYCISKKRENGRNYIIVQKRADDFRQIVYKEEVEDGEIIFRLEAKKKSYEFFYSVNGRENPAGNAATRFLSVEIAGKCFTGTLIGLYAQCEGQTEAEAEICQFYMEK